MLCFRTLVSTCHLYCTCTGSRRSLTTSADSRFPKYCRRLRWCRWWHSPLAGRAHSRRPGGKDYVVFRNSSSSRSREWCFSSWTRSDGVTRRWSLAGHWLGENDIFLCNITLIGCRWVQSLRGWSYRRAAARKEAGLIEDEALATNNSTRNIS